MIIDDFTKVSNRAPSFSSFYHISEIRSSRKCEHFGQKRAVCGFLKKYSRIAVKFRAFRIRIPKNQKVAQKRATFPDGRCRGEGGEHMGFKMKNGSYPYLEGLPELRMGCFADAHKLRTVEFRGTAQQWNAVQCGRYWHENAAFEQVCCEDGTVDVRDTE